MSYEQYWIKRAEQRIAERQSYLDASIMEIDSAYTAAMKELEKDINRIILQFTRESNLTRKEVEQLLAEEIPARELESIRERIASIEDEDILKELQLKQDATYYRNRISRKQALQEAIQIQMSRIADRELAISTAAYVHTLKEEYLQNIFDCQQYWGFAYSFTELPEKVIEQILKDDWSKKHYSKRIWGNAQTIANQVETTVLKGAMLGTNSRKMARELNKIADTGMFACERLIRTETTYFTAMADLEAAKQRGTKKLQFVATLDSRTSEQCRKADGMIIDIEEAVPGKNIPPLHPFCRSVIIDVIEGLVHKVRRARNPETGKNYLVPVDMMYTEWKKGIASKVMLKDEGNAKYNVRWDRVNTEKYARKFQNLTGSKDADQSILEHTKEILTRRDGTDIEETYLINFADGSVMGHVIGESKETVMPQEVLDVLMNSDNNSIIMLHNHPSGNSFTVGDIENICGIGSIKGIVAAGHNGALFYADRPPYRTDIEEMYKRFHGVYKQQKVAGIRHQVWELMYEIFGVRYERR